MALQREVAWLKQWADQRETAAAEASGLGVGAALGALVEELDEKGLDGMRYGEELVRAQVVIMVALCDAMQDLQEKFAEG